MFSNSNNQSVDHAPQYLAVGLSYRSCVDMLTDYRIVYRAGCVPHVRIARTGKNQVIDHLCIGHYYFPSEVIPKWRIPSSTIARVNSVINQCRM